MFLIRAARTASVKAPRAAAKQGAYGKVRTHVPSVGEQMRHPKELAAMTKLSARRALKKFVVLSEELDSQKKPVLNHMSPHAVPLASRLGPEEWAALEKTSRSFAGVIRLLPRDAADAVCLFYLLLRALDTIEDEMDLKKFRVFIGPQFASSSLEAKRRLLDDFWTLIASDARESAAYPSLALASSSVGEGDENALLSRVNVLIQSVRASIPNQDVQHAIREVVREMGQGMGEFASRDLSEGTVDRGDYDRYCHFVAGTVGHGLTRIFAALGLEADASELVKHRDLWDACGMFLQRTNIVRDVCEDAAEGRAFWPQEIWRASKDAPQSISELRDVTVLNRMVANALELLPNVVKYLDRLEHPEILRFCAIPQVMALATLEACYDNSNVFTGVVKIRSGTAARIVLALDDEMTAQELRDGYCSEMSAFLETIARKARRAKDRETAQRCEEILETFAVRKLARKEDTARVLQPGVGFAYLTFVAGMWIHLNASGKSTYLSAGTMFAGGDPGLAQAFALAMSSATGGALLFAFLVAVFA